MSVPKILIAAGVAAILSTLACALPRHIRSTDIQKNNNNRSPRSYDLKEVLNNTVCPIMVDYDIDEDRVPRRIKVLKCAAQPDHCSPNSGETYTPHKCCTRRDVHHLLECVEIRDQIYVTYKAKPRCLKVIEVPVGCSCMIKNISKASKMPGN